MSKDLYLAWAERLHVALWLQNQSTPLTPYAQQLFAQSERWIFLTFDVPEPTWLERCCRMVRALIIQSEIHRHALCPEAQEAIADWNDFQLVAA